MCATLLLIYKKIVTAEETVKYRNKLNENLL